MNPSAVTLLGRVSSDKPSSVESTPKQKKQSSNGSLRSSKRKHSSKPTSDNLKYLDDKWSERISRLEAMLLKQSLVRPVNSASVVPREHPFFDLGASTSVMFSEGTGSCESTQLTATQPPLGVTGTQAVRDENESATRPVQCPGTSEVLATQPLLVPGAGTATQPSQAPGAGPEVLPSGCETTLSDQSPSGGRNTEVARNLKELDGEPASPASIHDQSDLPETTTHQDLSEDANYRETITGVRSFIGWHHIPDYDNSAASMDDNPFAGSRVKTTGKVSVKLPVDEWLCRKLEKLNVTVAEGYPSRNNENSGLLRDQFVKTPQVTGLPMQGHSDCPKVAQHALVLESSGNVQSDSPVSAQPARSFKRTHCKGNLISSRKQVAHKLLGTKGGLSGLKRVPRPLFKQHSPGSHRQHNSGCLYQQRGGDEIGLPVCPTVENPVLVHQEAGNPQGTSHPRPAERDSRQAIQTWPDYSNRMVSSPRSVPSYMLPVAPATSGPVCHQIQQQTTTVCVTGTRPPGMGSGCTQPVMGESGPICLPTSSHLGQSSGEVTGLPMQGSF